MSLSALTYTGISTTVTTGLSPIHGGAGSRTQTRIDIGISGAAQRESPIYYDREWVPPIESESVGDVIIPNPLTPPTYEKTGIIPGAQADRLSVLKITAPPTPYEYSPGYWTYDFSSMVETQYLIRAPWLQNESSTIILYDRDGNPLVFDCGSDLAGIPTWIFSRPVRYVWPGAGDGCGWISDDVPTDPRATPFPWVASLRQPGRTHAIGPMRSKPYFPQSYRNGLVTPDDSKLYRRAIYTPNQSPRQLPVWWGIPSLLVQVWGQFYGSTAPSVTAVLHAVSHTGAVTTIDTQTVAMSLDLVADPYSSQVQCHIDQTFTSSASLPADCVFVYWTVSHNGSANPYAGYNENYLGQIAPTRHSSLLACPATGCGPSLGYVLKVN